MNSQKQKKYNVGDVVFASAREPMPISMKKELLRPQKIVKESHPLYVFHSGWSVNIELNDQMFSCRG